MALIGQDKNDNDVMICLDCVVITLVSLVSVSDFFFNVHVFICIVVNMRIGLPLD